MKHLHLINAVFHQPWLITPQAHNSIASLVRARVLEIQAERTGTGVCGEAVELEQMVIRDDGIAIIPVGGVLGNRLTAMAKGAGAVDFADIEKELEQAEGNESVRGIVLAFDSPGGMVNGTAELADCIVSCEKETMAWVPGMACSAAQWLAASCDVTVAAPTALLGSIGVYLPWVDQSSAYALNGYKADPIVSGEHKAAMFPGTALTAAQRAELQSFIDDRAEMFKTHIRNMRGNIPEEMMEGQSITAQDALSIGLIDAIERSMERAISLTFGS